MRLLDLFTQNFYLGTQKERFSSFALEKRRSNRTSNWLSSGTSWDQVESVLKSCYVAMSITEIMEIIGVTNRTKFRRKYIIPLIGEELLAMSIPDKPNSSLQKYYTTEKGKLLCQDEDEK